MRSKKFGSDQKGDSMVDRKGATVRWNRDNYVPRRILGFRSEPLAGTPRQAAIYFLKQNLEKFKISAKLSDLRYEKTAESLAARTVLFQQHFEGVPVHGAWVALHLDRNNRVFLVKNDTVPAAKLKQRLSRLPNRFLSTQQVDRIIRKKIQERGGVLRTRVKKESMIYAYKQTFRPVWKVKFGTRNPAASRILFIDRITGYVLEDRNVLRKLHGTGQVFLPNPVVTLNRDDLYDRRDADGDAFLKAYKKVVLRDLKSGGYLRGRYVDTKTTSTPAQSRTGRFVYTRHDDHFEEVMVYYHIDTVQRYIQALGFFGATAILDRPIKANAHGGPEDNSYYDPSPDKQDLTFGDGGVDDAEDAEIILHEYGHAIQDAIVPGFGQNHEGTAMGEGFGDYLAGSFFYTLKSASRRPRFAEWDVKAVVGDTEECLRRLDSAKHYPEDMVGEEHDDGEIWSACLWEVRKLLGRKKQILLS